MEKLGGGGHSPELAFVAVPGLNPAAAAAAQLVDDV